MSETTSEVFVIEIEETQTQSLGMVDSVPVMERIKLAMQAILAKLKLMLKGNLPAWSVVEVAVVTAFNQYIRPMSIPDWIDDILLKALIGKAKEIYAEFA